MGKGIVDVEHGMVEGQALALVYRDGPCQAQGVLREGALHLFPDFLGLLVDDVARVLPGQAGHLDGPLLALAEHLDEAVGKVGHLAYLAVVIEMLGRGVVLQEHHLGTDLQSQLLLGGIAGLGEIARDFCIVEPQFAGQFSQPLLVVALRHVVVGGEAYPAFSVPGHKVRHVARVELVGYVLVDAVLAYLAQEANKAAVALAVDALQLYGDVLDLLQGTRAEEIGGLVVGVEQLPLLVGGHGGELLQVTDEQQLHAAEGPVAVAVLAQHAVDGIEQVATHHGYLVDDEEVEGAQDALLLLAHLEETALAALRHHARQMDAGRELEKGVDGGTAGIDGSHARGGHHDHAFGGQFPDTTQKGGLARTGASCEEDRHVSAFHKLPCKVHLVVVLCHSMLLLKGLGGWMFRSRCKFTQKKGNSKT